MRDVMVMNTLGLGFLSNEAKKLVKSVVDISKKMLMTCLKIQYNAALFPFYFLYGGLKYVYEQFTSDSVRAKTTGRELLEPRNDEVIRSTQRVQKTTLDVINSCSSKRDTGTATNRKNSISNNERQYRDALSDQIAPLRVSDFSGCDLMWDVPIISAKAEYFARCLKERNIDKTAVARKVLEEHAINNQMPKTGKEYDRMLKEAKNGPEYFNDAEFRCDYNTAASSKLTSNILEKNTQKLESCSNGTTSDRYSQMNKNTECVCGSKFIQGKIMRHEIATIGLKLRRIRETCSSLLKGLSTLNDNLSKYVSMKEKMANLENDVKEGKRLLKEVEYDRSMMKTKLLALEELITEEQQFLFESSFESGFYETNERTAD